MRWILLAWLMLWTSLASADEIEELQGLQGELVQLAIEIKSDDCAVSCQALESMMRAVRRICELDAGTACELAKEKLEAARERVREACPDCAVADKEDETRAADDPAPPAPTPEALKPPPGAAPMSPPAEDATGGCAACAIGDDSSTAAWWAWMALGLVVAARRRRRDDRSRR